MVASDDEERIPHLYGRPKEYDPDFRGPVRQRKCTDILCLIILFGSIFFYFTIGLYGWFAGKPERLAYPIESSGRICGQKYRDLDTHDKPFLHYFDMTRCTFFDVERPLTGREWYGSDAAQNEDGCFQTAANLTDTLVVPHCPTQQACVSRCPSEYWDYRTVEELLKPLEEEAKENDGNFDTDKLLQDIGGVGDTLGIGGGDDGGGDGGGNGGGGAKPSKPKGKPKGKRSVQEKSKRAKGLGKLVDSVFGGPNEPNRLIDTLDIFSFNGLSIGNIYDVYKHLSPGRIRNAKAVDWSKFVCVPGYVPVMQYVVKKKSIKEIIEGGCAAYTVPTRPVQGICMPNMTKDDPMLNNVTNFEGEQVGDLMKCGVQVVKFILDSRPLLHKIACDFAYTWTWIVSLLLLSAVMSWVWIILMKYFSYVMTWFTYISCTCMCLAATLYCWLRFANLQNSVEDNNLSTTGSMIGNRYLWTVVAIMLMPIDFILIMFLVFDGFKRIQNAARVINFLSETQEAVWSFITYPWITWVLTTLITSYWLLTSLFITSTSKPVFAWLNGNYSTENSMTKQEGNMHGNYCNIQITDDVYTGKGEKCSFVGYETALAPLNLIWLFVIWKFLSNWIISLGQLTMAGTFGMYYWVKSAADDVPYLPVFSSFGTALRYHSGTLTYGSLVLPVVTLPRFMVEWFYHVSRRYKLCHCARCLCGKCFQFVGNYLKYFNRNAIIMVALYGEKFRISAERAFQLVMRNNLRYPLMDYTVEIIMIIAQLQISIITSAIAVTVFSENAGIMFGLELNMPGLNYYWLPVLVTSFSSFAISQTFFNVFSITNDANWICYMEDREMGSRDRKYVMEKSLLKLTEAPGGDFCNSCVQRRGRENNSDSNDYDSMSSRDW